MKTDIDGKTSVIGVIGNPISHSFSPVIHNLFAKELNHNFVYVPFLVDPGHLKEAVAGAHALNIIGLNVTLPHKTNVMEYIEVDENTRKIGAVNTLLRTDGGYIGYNTDAPALCLEIQGAGITLKDKNVVIFGAGGGAYAAGAVAAEFRAAKVYIVNRTLEKADKLAKHLTYSYGLSAEVCKEEYIHDADILLQTTSVGLRDDCSIIERDSHLFKTAEAAVDIVYPRSKFLEYAKDNGLVTMDGFSMLVHQAALSYSIWTGQKEDFFHSIFEGVKNAYQNFENR